MSNAKQSLADFMAAAAASTTRVDYVAPPPPPVHTCALPPITVEEAVLRMADTLADLVGQAEAQKRRQAATPRGIWD